MKAVWIMVSAAAVGFFVLFSPWTKPHIPFFPLMTLTAGLLAATALVLQRKQLKNIYAFSAADIPLGLIAAAVLYGIFWVGHALSTRLLPFAASQVDAIYTIRGDLDRWLVAGLLLFVIGPAEEIFWRGFVQNRLSNRYGVLVGLILGAAVYALVHVWSFNFMLLAASAICGGFWGLLYAATGSLWPAIISHAVWDVAIFILWPIT
jgi:membrane protease YdiL (CAAX protease family)